MFLQFCVYALKSSAWTIIPKMFRYYIQKARSDLLWCKSACSDFYSSLFLWTVYTVFLTGWRSLSCTKPCHGVYQRLIHAKHAQSRQIKWRRAVLEGQQAIQAGVWHSVVKMLVVNRCSVSAFIAACCWPLTRGQVAEDDKLWLVCAAQCVYLCVCVCPWHQHVWLT